ncbi:hypothetical protein GCM10007049_30310 [Echinicola pacifica]|uniref:Uncharacterized protein n=1 Tax=Echinicola pacifica TaxID=346377 RepID=A0A918Q7T9_9BACT|nr:hypothetical protein [Echinicola pacifica]GGZ34843.1 hypothetical protein GCM10007049_30310 [Echinicola pacifica]
MTELILYAILFILLFAHAIMASMMYNAVHRDENLSINEKNSWKLKALILPGLYWKKYKASKEASQ